MYPSFWEIYTFSTPPIHFHAKGSCRSIMVFNGQWSIIIFFIWSVMQFTTISLHYRCKKKTLYTSFWEVYTSSTLKICITCICTSVWWHCDYNLNSTTNIFSQLATPWKEVSKGSLVAWQKSWIFLPNVAFPIRKAMLSSVTTVRFF